GARPGARMARDESAGAEPRLAQAPDCPLLRGVEERRYSSGGALPPRLGSKPLCRRTHVVVGVGAKLDDEERAPGGQKPHSVEPLGAREIGEMMVETLQCLRAML